MKLNKRTLLTLAAVLTFGFAALQAGRVVVDCFSAFNVTPIEGGNRLDCENGILVSLLPSPTLSPPATVTATPRAGTNTPAASATARGTATAGVTSTPAPGVTNTPTKIPGVTVTIPPPR